MPYALPLDEMTTCEKLQALEALWDSLARQASAVPSPLWHRDELARRQQRVEAGQSTFTELEQAKQRLRDATS